MNLFHRLVRVWPALVVVAASLILAGCGMTGSNPPPSGSDVNPDYSTRFRSGDKIVIQFTEPGMPSPWEQTIGENGQISLPHNQSVMAEGKTRAQLQQDIQDVYVPKLYRRMNVNIQSEDRFYFVRGEVRNPNQFRYVSSMTVLKAIATAGDFTNFANRRSVQVIRSTGEQFHVNPRAAMRDPSQDVPIYPGDIVVVERRL